MKYALRHLLLGSAAALALGGTALGLPQSPTIAGSNAGLGGAAFSGAGSNLTVNQSASRVVIDWQSFSIANGESVTFNQGGADWIAFNRVQTDPLSGLAPLSTISGSLTAQGGVWLFSPGGVVIGSTAQIDVGSLALVTAPLAGGDLNQLLTPDGSGLTTVSLDPPAGVGVEVITVQNGAKINATSGYVALQAETIHQGGAITAADGVGYAVARTGQIKFLTSDTGQQLQSASVTFLVGQDRPSFTHTGSTRAAWVGIDTPGGTLQADYHTLVSLGGSVVATGVKPDGSANGVVLLVGDNQGPSDPNYTNSSIGVDASGASITATNGVYILSNSAKLGAAQVGGPLDVETYGDIAVTAPLTIGGRTTLNSIAGAVDLGADITGQQSISASAQAITVGPGVTIRSDSLGAANGGVTLSSAGDIIADASSLLVAGPDAAAPTDNITLNAGTGAAGGDITLGGIAGYDVYTQAFSGGATGRGAITFKGSAYGAHSLLASVDDVSSQNQPTGALSILGSFKSGGFIDIENLGSGSVIVGPGANVQSTGNQVFVYSGGATTVAAGGQVTGASILVHTVGLLTVASGATLSTTGAPAAVTAPVLPYGAEYQRTTGLNLAAGSVSIQGAVTAGGAGARDDILFEVLKTAAPAVIGGTGGGAGFNLTNADFGHLTARNVVIMSGPGEANGAGVDLQVHDLTLDSGKISGLWLGAASSRKIQVSGAVTTSVANPVSLQIGFVRQGLGGAGQGAGGGTIVNPNPTALDGFIPGEIDITGAVGSAAAPLGQVSLIARQDIFIGSSAFITAAAANPGFDAVKDSGLYPGQDGRVLVAAASLQVSAQGRIIQQNTSAFPYTGLVIGAPTAARPLVAAPAALAGKSIGGGAWTANYAAGPVAVDLFGVFTPVGGPPVTGIDAARLANLSDSGVTIATADRINSCSFGDVCVPLTTSLRFELPTQVIQSLATADPTQPQAQFVALNSAVTDLVSSYAAISNDIGSERLGSTNPVTESGNRELWTNQRKRRRP